MSTQLATDIDTTIIFSAPKKYKVVLFNDNTTPIDFVIELLITVFSKQINEAEYITMDVHENGRGVAGLYPFEIAEQKVAEAVAISRANGYPLSLDVEEE